MPEGSDKVPIVIWAHASGGADAYIFSEFINSAQKKLLDLGIGVMFIDNFCSRGVTIGGMHGEEYLPQFINFFKENLL